MEPVQKGRASVLTGLGTPNEMRKFVKSGVVQKFQLWDPADIGDVAAFLASEIVASGKKIEPGMTFQMPGKGELKVLEKNIVIAGSLVTFDATNIDKYQY